MSKYQDIESYRQKQHLEEVIFQLRNQAESSQRMIDEGNRKLSENNSHISQLVQINSNIANLVQSQQRQAYGPARSKQHLKQYGKMTISSSIINISTSNRYTITYQTQDIFGNTTTINRYIYMTNFIAIPYNSTNIVYFGHTTFFNPTTIKPSYTFLLEDLTNRNPPLPDITGTFSEDMIILNSPDFMINPTFLIIKDLIPHQYL